MDGESVRIIDQRKLPFEFVLEDLASLEDVAIAIEDMHVRGAGCIGATAGYGMVLAVAESLRADSFESALAERVDRLVGTRPTATNYCYC